MLIYGLTKRFNQLTGEPEHIKTLKEVRCDYTGLILDGFDDQYCVYHLDYEDRDPCFGSGDEEFKFGEEFNINMFEFLSNPYHFYVLGGEDGCYAETQMMEKALANANKKKSEWHNCYTFDAMCRQARILTARKLINDGAITSDQLTQN